MLPNEFTDKSKQDLYELRAHGCIHLLHLMKQGTMKVDVKEEHLITENEQIGPIEETKMMVQEKKEGNHAPTRGTKKNPWGLKKNWIIKNRNKSQSNTGGGQAGKKRAGKGKRKGGRKGTRKDQ